MGNFKADKQQSGQDTIVTLVGHIDEDAVFSSIDIAAAPKVVVDMDGVSAINSCGIREWVKWIRTANATAAITFRKCPKVIVDQINMVEGFLPKSAKVESFYVPYFADASGNEKMILFRDGTEFKGSEVHAPKDVKDDDGEPMEMDVIEAKYFKFLQKA
jgi:anti-anti-sigma regulatory factor